MKEEGVVDGEKGEKGTGRALNRVVIRTGPIKTRRTDRLGDDFTGASAQGPSCAGGRSVG